jgi:hypothetical protein
MKRAFLMATCACASPSAVEIVAPLATTSVSPAPNDEVSLPHEATLVTSQSSGTWAADFPRAKTYAVYDVQGAARVLLTWRVGESDVAKNVAPVDLVVRGRGDARAISFGELSGVVEPWTLSWCPRSGFHAETGDVWNAENSAVASSFSIGLMQGSDDMIIVKGGSTLHVLHRESSDGRCLEKKQGPLDVCADFEWKLAADIRVSPSAAIHETVEVEGKPFDCGIELWGGRLIK